MNREQLYAQYRARLIQDRRNVLAIHIHMMEIKNDQYLHMNQKIALEAIGEAFIDIHQNRIKQESHDEVFGK